MRPQRVGAAVLSGLGGFAVVLSILGVYGSTAHAVACRMREIGVRIALGASAMAVIGTTISGTMKWVGVGLLAGVAAALVVAKLAEPYLFEVAPHDVVTYSVVIAAVVVVAVSAGLVPVLRAIRADSLKELIREAMYAE